MSVHTYKCPNCDAELTFRPATGDFGCEYCGSRYTKTQLDALETAKEGEERLGESRAEAQAQSRAEAQEEFSQRAAVYTCPSCGAEVIADKTTAATFCYYCHSPVLLTDQLAGEFRPDRAIPFAIGREEVKRRFLDWCKKKRFIRPDFCDASQLEKLSGVYFPFWVVDGRAKASFSAKGTRLRVWAAGDIEYTETKIYQLRREGELFFNDVTVKALGREDAELLNGIYPYETEDMPDFSMPYLSGFLAEKRDIGRDAAEQGVYAIMEDSAERLLRDTAAGCGTLSEVRCRVEPQKSSEEWLYCLLPAWMLTYDYRGEKYYYAMNAQTGKIAGRVPVSGKKLALLFGGVLAAATALGAILGGIL